MAVSSWIEANNGLLSLAAIVLALALAAFEHVRALDASTQRFRSDVDVAIGVIDELLTQFARLPPHPNETAHDTRVFRDAAQLAEGAIEAIASKAHSAGHAVALQLASMVLHDARDGALLSKVDSTTRTAITAQLGRAKTALQLCRPPTLYAEATAYFRTLRGRWFSAET